MTQIERPAWVSCTGLHWNTPQYSGTPDLNLKSASSKKNENKPPVFIANMQYRGLVPQPLLTHAEDNAMVRRNAKRKEMGKLILKKASKLGLKAGTNNNVRSGAAVTSNTKPAWLAIREAKGF